MITHGFYITRLHLNITDVTENNSARIIFIELLCILLSNFIILDQLINFCWNNDFDIGNNIAAAKSSLAATIDVFVHRCHLSWIKLCIT